MTSAVVEETSFRRSSPELPTTDHSSTTNDGGDDKLDRDRREHCLPNIFASQASTGQDSTSVCESSVLSYFEHTSALGSAARCLGKKCISIVSIDPVDQSICTVENEFEVEAVIDITVAVERATQMAQIRVNIFFLLL
jgi:hypothetical protein